MSYKLFLDDERFPVDPENWIIVRNYFELVKVIAKMGPPSHVSFDHDLGQVTGNGLTCASALINFDMDHWEGAWNKDYYVHSQNPVGKKNIEELIESYKNHTYKWGQLNAKVQE